MIKRFFCLVGILLFLMSVSITSVYAQQGQDYQKFGRIATAVVKEDYPGQDVVEYQYLGRRKADETKVIDTFRFEVMKNDKPLFVHIRIIHDLKDTKHLSLTLEEKEQ